MILNMDFEEVLSKQYENGKLVKPEIIADYFKELITQVIENTLKQNGIEITEPIKYFKDEDKILVTSSAKRNNKITVDINFNGFDTIEYDYIILKFRFNNEGQYKNILSRYMLAKPILRALKSQIDNNIAIVLSNDTNTFSDVPKNRLQIWTRIDNTLSKSEDKYAVDIGMTIDITTIPFNNIPPLIIRIVLKNADYSKGGGGTNVATKDETLTMLQLHYVYSKKELNLSDINIYTDFYNHSVKILDSVKNNNYTIDNIGFYPPDNVKQYLNDNSVLGYKLENNEFATVVKESKYLERQLQIKQSLYHKELKSLISTNNNSQSQKIKEILKQSTSLSININKISPQDIYLLFNDLKNITSINDYDNMKRLLIKNDKIYNKYGIYGYSVKKQSSNDNSIQQRFGKKSPNELFKYITNQNDDIFVPGKILSEFVSTYGSLFEMNDTEKDMFKMFVENECEKIKSDVYIIDESNVNFAVSTVVSVFLKIVPNIEHIVKNYVPVKINSYDDVIKIISPLVNPVLSTSNQDDVINIANNLFKTRIYDIPFTQYFKSVLYHLQMIVKVFELIKEGKIESVDKFTQTNIKQQASILEDISWDYIVYSQGRVEIMSPQNSKISNIINSIENSYFYLPMNVISMYLKATVSQCDNRIISIQYRFFNKYENYTSEISDTKTIELLTHPDKCQKS